MKNIGFSIALLLTVNGNSLPAGLGQSQDDRCFKARDITTLYKVQEQAKFNTGSKVYSSPTIAKDGTVVVGAEDGYVYFLRPDGTKRARFKTRGRVISSPHHSQGRNSGRGLMGWLRLLSWH